MALPFTLQTIEDGFLKGKTFRRTNDVPRKTAVVDWIMGITGYSRAVATARMNKIISAHKAVIPNLVSLQFEGERQRPTPCTDATGLLFILDKLPRKYVKDFQQERDVLLARYLGGDTSISGEVAAIRDAQQQLPEDHAMRVFGEAVETGQIGNLAEERVKGMSSEEKIEWHTNRGDSIRTYKAKAAVVQSLCQANHLTPHQQTKLYIELNSDAGKAVTGKAPGQFRRVLGLPKCAPIRDFFSKKQLVHMESYEAYCSEVMSDNMLTLDERRAKVKQMSQMVFGMCRAAGHHNIAQPAGPPVLDTKEKEKLASQGGRIIAPAPKKRRLAMANLAIAPVATHQQITAALTSSASSSSSSSSSSTTVSTRSSSSSSSSIATTSSSSSSSSASSSSCSSASTSPSVSDEHKRKLTSLDKYFYRPTRDASTRFRPL